MFDYFLPTSPGGDVVSNLRREMARRATRETPERAARSAHLS